MKILIIFLIVLFFYNKDIISLSVLEAINIWYKNLFPSIFPVLILCDLIISFNVFDRFIKLFGKTFSRFFKISNYGLLVFLISLLCGTPSNMVLANTLYQNNLLSKEDINKLIPLCLFFNPLFVISFTNKKVFIIIIISSIITGVLFRNKKYNLVKNDNTITREFNLSKTIEKSMNTLLNILGTVAVFMLLSNLIIIKKPIVSCILGGFFEITTGLYKTNLFFKNNNILYILFLSFGGLSIITQMKSVLKDIKLDYSYIFFQRLIVFLISVFICILT